jgi:catechol 2,3-dioxygenase-like lactoylglutathione lyase family enzyme
MLHPKGAALTRRSILILVFGLVCTLNLFAQSPDLVGVAHVAFRVDDLQKAREFYQKLGFEQAFEFSDAGKTSVAFIKINDRQFIELYPRTDPSQPGGLMHICFEANHIQAVHDAYVKQGLQPTEVKKARAGNLLFVMHDPEGQLLEYTQYLPGSLHSESRGKHLGSTDFHNVCSKRRPGCEIWRRNARFISASFPSWSLRMGPSFTFPASRARGSSFNPRRPSLV